MDKPRNSRRPKKSAYAKTLEKVPLHGWRTTDDDEVALRRWRGRTEITVAIEALEPRAPRLWHVPRRSNSGSAYEVEIRDLATGTIPAAASITARTASGLASTSRACSRQCASEAGAAANPASLQRRPRRGLFLRVAGGPGILALPMPVRMRGAALLAPFCTPDGALTGLARRPGAVAAARSAPKIRPRLAPSRRLAGREVRLAAAKGPCAIPRAIEAGRASWDIVTHPLLPYQQEGAAHLAFHERALLADEMGLGKTVQAIAACELLARRKASSACWWSAPPRSRRNGRSRSPASPIARALRRSGPRPRRLAAYPRAGLLHHRQLRAGARATPTTSTSCCLPTWSCSTRRSASRTGRPRPRGG